MVYNDVVVLLPVKIWDLQVGKQRAHLLFLLYEKYAAVANEERQRRRTAKFNFGVL